MRAFGRIGAAMVCIAALGTIQLAVASGSAGAGGSEDQGDVPIVDGTTITATYRYEGKPFFEGGYILKDPQLDNFVSIDCGPNGVMNPAGGPDGAPECGFHPAATEATVTLTGEQPWFDVDRSFEVVPYWSFDDETYVKGEPITLKAPKAGKGTKEEAGERYLVIGQAVNEQVTSTVEKVKSWDAETTGKEAAADVEGLERQLDDAKRDLKGLQKAYPPAKRAIKQQRKAIDALRTDLGAVGAINDGVDLESWKEQFDAHLQDLKSASDDVRAALGLILTFDSGETPASE